MRERETARERERDWCVGLVCFVLKEAKDQSFIGNNWWVSFISVTRLNFFQKNQRKKRDVWL